MDAFRVRKTAVDIALDVVKFASFVAMFYSILFTAVYFA